MNLFKRFISFCSQVQKIKKEFGCLRATCFVTKAICHKFFKIAVILPLAAFIVCLRPWVKIRFFPLSCLTIGHYAIATEILLCKMDQDKNNKCKEKIIFLQLPKSEVCNVQLYEMWKRILTFVPNALFSISTQIESRLEHWCGISYWRTILGQACYDRWDVLEASSQHLNFTKNELFQGERILETMGIPSDAKFICLLVRDAAYYANNPAHDLYNNMSSFRNADIITYRKAALFLADSGYYVLRMGKKVKNKFDLNHEKVIDYANSPFRSDFMDVYLSAHCYFFMTTLSGLDAIAHAFRRPVLATNISRNGLPCIGYPVKLFLTKKYINKNTGQLLSFKQQNKIFRLETAHEFIYKMLDKYSLEVIDNTEDEILEATKETLLRMQENFCETELSEALHKKLWSEIKYHISEGMVEKFPICEYQARYCMADLLNNRALLEQEIDKCYT